MKKLIKFSICNRNLENSLKISIIVGTILTIINQYQIIFESNLIGFETIIQIILNYLVPFIVATYSAYNFKCKY